MTPHVFCKGTPKPVFCKCEREENAHVCRGVGDDSNDDDRPDDEGNDQQCIIIITSLLC